MNFCRVGSGLLFQSTLPRGERPCTAQGGRSMVPDFNPRSREGSDDILSNTLIIFPISIHAPARGATQTSFVPEMIVTAFQSTLPRGERHVQNVDDIMHGLFQSTLPRGERRCKLNLNSKCLRFQSTLPRGERQFWISICSCFYEFQSTLPRGERRYTQHTRQVAHTNFNPRSREGSDGM